VAAAAAIEDALTGISTADALAANTSAIVPANVASHQACRNTRLIASPPAPSMIVKELGRRVNCE
jgi:hypothetical protein